MGKFILKPIKDEISIEDFAKIDIRVGEIDEVLDIPRSNNLMKLVINFGDHKRTIIAGIKKERKNPKEIQGKQALFVINPVSYTHLRAHETRHDLVCRLL